MSGSIRFGSFEVDPNSGELRKQGVRVKLQEQPEQVVTREQLRQRLWPADTFVDFDHGLYNAIKRLREALGDTAETARFIEKPSRSAAIGLSRPSPMITVRKRGQSQGFKRGAGNRPQQLPCRGGRRGARGATGLGFWREPGVWLCLSPCSLDSG
ncbi:MAG TPA: winged helix-turn-helix domain-containing protein [Terriglobales bacterium]|nr:winged helix-turn-helix domain-containing protein [Terriglobales bacterium]